MQRRKFIIGLGSIAAGASTVMGTGALSNTKIDRGLTGNVAKDGPGSAYITVDTDNSGGPNRIHSDVNSDGELVLDFASNEPSSQSGQRGRGLNADSVNNWDNVFGLQNLGNEDMNLYITKNGPNVDRLDFYKNQDESRSIVGSGNSVSWPDGTQVNVGVTIDLDNSGLDRGSTLDDLFQQNDTFTIHGEEVNSP